MVVDPGDAQSALDCRQARTLQLWGILNTDHPADQSGGMGEAPLLIDAERSTHPILRSDAPAGIASVTRFDAQGVHGVSRFATLRS